ncbi:hypothetical protein FKM82_030017 [Ascaphus truei]
MLFSSSGGWGRGSTPTMHSHLPPHRCLQEPPCRWVLVGVWGARRGPFTHSPCCAGSPPGWAGGWGQPPLWRRWWRMGRGWGCQRAGVPGWSR